VGVVRPLVLLPCQRPSAGLVAAPVVALLHLQPCMCIMGAVREVAEGKQKAMSMFTT
jgi:hypothetical protein